MKCSVQLLVVALAAVGLSTGMFLGIRPITVPLTLISPEVREVTVACGIGFLPGVPALGSRGTVSLPNQPGVVVPRSAYAEHCDRAGGWSPYLAWGLTGIGVLGLALIFVARRSRIGVWPG